MTSSSFSIPELFYVHSSESSRTLKEYLGMQTQLPMKEAYQIVKAICQVVVDAHGQQRLLGVLDASTIVVLKTDVSKLTYC